VSLFTRSILPGRFARLWTPERGLFKYRYKIEDGKLLIKAGEMPTPSQPVANTREEDDMRLIKKSESGSICGCSGRADSRNCRASGSA